MKVQYIYWRGIFEVIIHSHLEEIMVGNGSIVENIAKTDGTIEKRITKDNLYFCSFNKEESNGPYDSTYARDFYYSVGNSENSPDYIPCGNLGMDIMKDIWSQVERNFNTPKYVTFDRVNL